MESKTLTSLRDAKAAYDSAVRTNMNVSAKKQALVNILLSHATELIESALDVEDLLKKKMEGDKEIARLKKKLDEFNAWNSDVSEREKPASAKQNG